MPISEKIENGIKRLRSTDEDKELMLNILKLEDEGVKHYTVPYENEIDAYISSKKYGGMQNDRNIT